MFSKFLRRISVAVIGVIFLLGAFSGMSLCAKAQSPGTGELEVFQIEQVRAEMPQIQVYVRGVNANEACEAYLDGNALTSTGNQSLDENGTSYLIMLDISGSITSEYFLAAKKQVEELAQNLGPKDKITLITFGDTVKMQVSDSQNADEISKILALLQAKDKKTNLYRAFDQCLKYVEAESQKERQIVLVISDGIQDTGDAGITQEELETRLTQASMPVYAFCVDTADRQSRDGLGTFARTTGGELFVFGPQNAAQVWQKWKERLNQTVCLGFESTANYADGELHTLLLKETAGAQSDTRQIRITNWLVDDTAPEVISFRYDNEKNTIEIEFSEPVLGADKANAYGTSTAYTNWHSGEPNNQDGIEHYAMFYEKFQDGTWNDADGIIDAGCAYICEWDDPTDKISQGDSFTDQQLRIIAKGLGVPDDLNVEIKQYPKTYWKAAGLWDIYVEVLLDGKVIASGSFDVETGEMGRNIYIYSPI